MSSLKIIEYEARIEGKKDHTPLATSKWLKENLFSSPLNILLTAASIFFLVFMIDKLVGFVFSEERNWDAVRINLRLLFTHAYPESQYSRVWVSLAVIVVLAGLSLGLLSRFGSIPLSRISAWLMTSGGLVALGIVLSPPQALTADSRTYLRDAVNHLIRLSFVESVQALVEVVPSFVESVPSFVEAMTDRKFWWLAALVLVGSGVAVYFGFGTFDCVRILDRRRLGVGDSVYYGLGDLIHRVKIASVPFFFMLLGLLVASAWLYPWGHFSFVQGEYFYEPGRTVALSTKIPWTVMWALLVSSWFVGALLRTVKIVTKLRVAVNVLWLLMPFLLYWVVLRDPSFDIAFVFADQVSVFEWELYWVVLRDPSFDWPRIWSVDVPLALAFVVGGGVVLLFLTRSIGGELDRVIRAIVVLPMLLAVFTWSRFWSVDIPILWALLAFVVGGGVMLVFLALSKGGEFERVISVLLLIFALFNWVAGFFGLYAMPQKVRISFLLFALFALFAHNCIGAPALRLRLISGWAGLIVIVHYLVVVMNAPSTLEVSSSETFIGGFSVTLIVATFTLLFSFPLGILVGLARTSKMHIFRVLASGYIEAVRGIPLITVLFFFSVMVPLVLPGGMDLSKLAAIIIGYTLFSTAYLAENVRGGLQSVRRGQYEASDAVGLNVGQRTAFIVLPQALRVSIPPLVGQVISVFKETSLIAIVGGFDFLRIADNIIPSQTEFVGSRREALLFVSVVYWLVAFSMSKYSQRLEQRLGLGKR